LNDWQTGNRRIALIAGLMVCVGLSLTGFRITSKYQTPGPFTPERQGLCDFHNGIYYPTRAVLAGESPYSEAYAAKYPVARQIPFFSPVILLLHAPLAVLPLHAAEAIHALIQIVLLFLIAIFTAREIGLTKRLDAILVITAAMIFSRGGHITLFNGYFTFELVLATFLAIAWADRRPGRSALMLAFISAKPTYILPLGFLMLARGNWRSILLGAVISIAATVASLGWLAYHQGDGDVGSGVSKLMQQILQTQEVHRAMEDESPVHSWTRLDLFAIIAKWSGSDPGELPHLIVMFAILAMPIWILWKRHRQAIDDGVAGVTGALLMTSMLVSLYHQSYDALLLVPPIAGLACSSSSHWQRMKWQIRCSLVLLLACPLANYLSTRMFLLRLEISETMTRVLTSLNGISLTLALMILCWSMLREPQSD
jgi:hypothetical protein